MDCTDIVRTFSVNEVLNLEAVLLFSDIFCQGTQKEDGWRC